MEMETRVHTVFMLVGSSECGKTTFAKEVMMPQLRLTDEERGLRANVQYLSSDGIRQELLGYAYDKYEQLMLESSSHAFQLLFERLKLVTSFPINAEFVIVDTIGLAEDFRAKVREIARDNHYNLEVVLFDYRKRDDYYASERSKKLITAHLNRLRKDVLPVLSREGYDRIHKVRAKDFYFPEERRANPEYRIAVENWNAYAASVLPRDAEYIVVGDVHECAEDLQGLLLEFGYRIEDGRMVPTDKVRGAKVILVGDWIDKGKDTREIVEFLHRNRAHFLFVLGNHENFVLKYINGEIKGADVQLTDAYFDSIPALQADGALFRKFAELVESSRPFYRYVGGDGRSSFYITHAPCRNVHIGKLDTDSLRRQRNFRLDRALPAEDQLNFLREEATGNHPYHLFGHVAAKKNFQVKNKIHLDTGCAHGNLLTGVRMSYKLFFKSRKSQTAAFHEELPTLFREERRVKLLELEVESVRRLRYCARHRINYISGTMSPADKDMEAGELESLRRGLEYFAERGVGEVVLQPKYMGSRCNVYLHRNLDECRAVSRNGYKVKAVDMQPIYEQLLRKFGPYMSERGIAMLVLDGELLPWKALGEGLIERQFRPIGKALETELDFLKRHGFEKALGELVETWENSGFEQDQHHATKEALNGKYGAHQYQTYKFVRGIRDTRVPLAQHEEAFGVYERQLELYAGDAEIVYKPFALLKEIGENGDERLPEGKTSDNYRFVSEDDYVVLNLERPDAYAVAERFFAKLTVENGMEGIVIKPELEHPGTVPYMKVRNAGYLSIIYGYDYKFAHKYGKLVKQKNIASKLRTSMNEFRLGQQMLAIKLSDIEPGNEQFNQIAANLLFEVAKEKEIDPRL
ncbi:Calcineurin-like phosphoesterase [Cohnella sp. OV330]|uniref:metallophosphoesterase n=1 Tax=Cohnella sp. OV330 TaxID=1855288 RepID=UPI0008EB423C|nr:metallophosphoesterase [Cohnella sp. OV330]SFB54323.1 Calcineurin-like phosphoesterase [Cohnella sp. OV330]